VAFSKSFFLFQGRDRNDKKLSDLFRFDTITQEWTQLEPIAFNFPFDTANLAGSSIVLSKWGVLRYGGYLRQPFMATTFVHGQSYVSDVYMADPVTLRWRRVYVDKDGLQSGGVVQREGSTVPAGRYLAASVFIPSTSLRPRHRRVYTERYHSPLPSTHANHAGSMSDSILVFGGHNGATGSFRGGENGGMLNELWMLRLANFSTAGSVYAQDHYREKHCAWRNNTRSSSAEQGVFACLDATESMSPCELRDILLMAWCHPDFMTQTIM
jgi:hypothetical protein